MQELIQAEIAETAREAAEKRSRRPRVSLRRRTVVSEASDADDGSFVESSCDSSEDDEEEAVVNNVEVSLIQFKNYLILTSLHHEAS
jgi:Mg2+ and Co2+ transporter CorA